MSRPGPAQPATGPADPRAGLRAQAAAARARSQELRQQTTHLLAQTQAALQASAQARRRRRSSPAGQDLTQHSAYARLLAQLETMPVIEQAKGIIMAHSHRGPAQAFDLLRRASQRANIPVRDLAAQIVTNTARVPPQRVRQISRADEVA